MAKPRRVNPDKKRKVKVGVDIDDKGNPIEGGIKPGTEIDVEEKVGNKTLKYKAVVEGTEEFDYGSGKTTVRQIAEQIYGDKADNHVESLAKNLLGKKAIAPDTDYGQYAVDMNADRYRSLGRHMANNSKDVVSGVITKNKNGINEFSSKTGVFEGIDQSDANAVTGSYNKSLKFANQREKVMGTLNKLEDKYGITAKPDANVVDKISSSEFQSIMDKLNKGQVLTKEEAKYFNDVKGTYGKVKGELEKVAEKNGIDLRNANVIGKPTVTEEEVDYVKNGVKKSFKVNNFDYSKTSDVAKMAKRSTLYSSLGVAEKAGIENFEVNADGTFKKIDVDTGEEPDKLKAVLKDIDQDNNFKAMRNSQVEEQAQQYEVDRKTTDLNFDNEYKIVDDAATEQNFYNSRADLSFMTQDEIDAAKEAYFQSDPVMVYDKARLKKEFGTTSIDKAKDQYYETNKYSVDETRIESEYRDSLNDVLKNSNGDAFYKDKNAADLYKLKKAGVKLSADEEEILRNYATAYKGGLGENSEVITKLKTASATAMENYGISSENIDYLDPNNNDRALKLIRDNDGKVKIDAASLEDEVKNNEKYKDLINSDNVAKENLKGIAEENLKIKTQKDIAGPNGSFKEFLTDVENELSELKDAENTKYGLSKKEQLVRMGMEDKYAEELLTAKDLNNVSLDALKDYKKIKGSQALGASEVELGNLSKGQIEKVLKTHGVGFNGKTEEQKRQLAANIFGIGDKDRLGAGMKVHMTGKEIKSASDLKDMYNNLIDKDGNIDMSKLSGMFSLENRKSNGSLGDIIKEALGGKKVADIKRTKDRSAVLSKIGDTLTNAIDKYGDGMSSEEKEKIKGLAGMFKNKDTKFTDEQMTALDQVIGAAEDYSNKLTKIDKSGIMENAKGLLNKSGAKKALGLAAAIGTVGFVANAIGNASEERERKRQEMNQLIAMQSSSLRGGY